MTAVFVRGAMAATYYSRALEAAAEAEASVLDRVREKHEVAAGRWRALAALHERGALGAPPAAPQDAHDIGQPKEPIPCTP